MSSNVTYANAAPGAAGVDRAHAAEQDYALEVVDAQSGVVRALGAARRKFAICGFAASSRMLAPFDDPEWEIWGLNQLYRHIPRETRHFDIHANWREDNVPGTDHPQWLAECGIPVYMSTHEPSIPTSVNYPLKAVMERVVGADYFTSTVAFMVALAIYEIDLQVDADVAKLEASANAVYADDILDSIEAAPSRDTLLHPNKFRQWLRDRYAERAIGIYGIDLVVGTEYDWQKSCVEYLLGLAEARNVTLAIPRECALLKQRWRYGYETEPAGQLIKMSELKRRQAALTEERANLIARLQTMDGALQETGYWDQVMDLRSKGAVVRLNEATSS